MGEKTKNPLDKYLSDVLTIQGKLTGDSILSLPGGKDSNHMPISFQLIAKPFEESSLFNFAHLYEKQHGWTYKNES